MKGEERMKEEVFDKIDFGDLTVTDRYLRFDLRANPFPMVGIASGSDPDTPPLGTQNLKDLHSFVASTYQADKFGAFAILGEYGFGKTYVLRHLHNRINEGLHNRGKDRGISIYIDSPRPTAADFAYEMLRGFGIEKFLVILWRILLVDFKREIRSKGDDFVKTLLPKKAQYRFFQDPPEAVLKEMASESMVSPLPFLDRILQSGVDLKRLGEHFKGKLAEFFLVRDLQERLSSFGSQSRALNCFNEWKDFLDLDLKRLLKKQEKEISFIRSFLTVLATSGFRMIYVLIDEFENSLLAPTRLIRRMYCHNLRELFDSCGDLMSVIIAIQPGAWVTIEKESPAFRARFSRVIEIDNVSREELKRIVKTYLNRERVPNSSYVDTFYPFEEDTLDEIRNFSLENLRVCLESCFVLIEYAAENTEVREIGPDLIELLPKIHDSFYEARKPRE